MANKPFIQSRLVIIKYSDAKVVTRSPMKLCLVMTTIPNLKIISHHRRHFHLMIILILLPLSDLEQGPRKHGQRKYQENSIGPRV